MWESPGHEMLMKEGQEKSHHHYAIPPRPLLHSACSLRCKYSQGKEECPSLGQTIPLRDSKALQGRESVGGAGCCCAWRELTAPRACKGEMTLLSNNFGNCWASFPFRCSSEGRQQHRVEMAIFHWKFRARFCCKKMKSKNFPVEWTSQGEISLEMPLNYFIRIVSSYH